MGNVPSSTAVSSSSVLQTTTAAFAAQATRADNHCGSAYGNALCAPGYCCSQYGWCGNTAAYCLPANGCQAQCSSSTTTISSKTTTRSTSTSTKTTLSTSTKTTTTATTSTSTKSTSTSTSSSTRTTSKSSTSTTSTSSTSTSATPSLSALTQVANYNAANWFSSFTAEDVPYGSDPSHGLVQYLNQSAGAAAGLYAIQNNQVYIGADHTTPLPASQAQGRNSMRISSNAAYNEGLFILDLAHTPASVCGVWPSFWLLGVGGNWPANGEIDVFEGVNGQTTNQITLHTTSGCNVTVGAGGQSGSSGETTCGADSNGCSVYTNAPFGTALNSAGGGVYALYWQDSQIRVWYWSHSGTPADVLAGRPALTNWGTPIANYGGCNFKQYMGPMNIIFNIDFCGDWAGNINVWGPTCGQQTGSTYCGPYVAQNPTVYNETYFLVNSLKVYQ